MEYLHISRIYIIQSLLIDETQTGERLKEDIDGYINFAGHPINCTLENAYNKGDFLHCLEKIAEESSRGSYPVVHIECHGSVNGLRLAGGDQISWDDLNEELTAINLLSRLNLIVVLGLCYGAHFIRSMRSLKRAPCLMFFGPTEKIFPQEIISSLTNFYRFLIYERDGDKSFKFIVNNQLKYGGFFMTTCIHFFKDIVEAYYEQTKGCDFERARRIRKRLKKENVANIASVGSIKRSLSKYEGDFIRRIYNEYFFGDLYPENRNRFSQLVGITNVNGRSGY